MMVMQIIIIIHIMIRMRIVRIIIEIIIHIITIPARPSQTMSVCFAQARLLLKTWLFAGSAPRSGDAM
ncbi:hypothetical protein N9L68_03505 [bacterium]|nr:hypothetical protein [bacterium]